MARSLSASLGLPVFHLDQAYWRPGWVAASPEAFQLEVERIAGLPVWVIDGNYTDTIASRLHAADTIIYLDVPSWLSVMRITRRALTNYGNVRGDAAPGCPERFDPEFLRFSWSWNHVRRARSLALVESFPGYKAVLRTKDDWKRFLDDVRRPAKLG